MSETIPFPTLRAKRPTLRTHGDNLADIATPQLRMSEILDAIRFSYLRLLPFVQHEREEARRLIEAELDLADGRAKECGNE
jgi:hypothetical protein